MRLSKFARSGIVFAAIWAAGSIFFNLPDTGAMNQVETRVFETCMWPIGNVEAQRRVEDRVAEMISKEASPREIRNYLIAVGFQEGQLRFADSVYREQRREGFFGEIPVLQAARIMRTVDCQSLAVSRHDDAVADAWLKVAVTTLVGLVLLWVALLVGRATLQWISRGT